MSRIHHVALFHWNDMSFAGLLLSDVDMHPSLLDSQSWK
jgi:hypothetical protein